MEDNTQELMELTKEERVAHKKAYMKTYRQKNKEHIRASNKSWREKNEEKRKASSKKWRDENKERFRAQKNAYGKSYYELNKESKIKLYRSSNREKIRSDMEAYRRENKEKMNNQASNRRKNNVVVKLRTYMASAIRKAFIRNSMTKTSRTLTILGCSIPDFKTYIESKWEPWMNWENYGKYNGTINYGWDLDHIIPLSIAETELEVECLNYYTNFQPLCSYTNRRIKRDKIMNEPMTKEQEAWLFEIYKQETDELIRRMEEDDDIGIADR